MDVEGIRASVAALTQHFVGDATMEQTLTRVCSAALDCVAPAVAAGISMTVDGRPGTYVCTDPDVPAVDRVQYETGDGPCVDALRTGRVVVVPSTSDPWPYPSFAAAARAHGFLAVVSLPLLLPGEVVGALNLYADREDAFTAHDVEVAESFAAQAAYLLANARAYWDARTLSENLQQAMASRAEIEQAKGILMARLGVDADRAFDLLREQSQHENVKLREIATEIVRRAATSSRPRAADA
jgi:GAF domain-containing protein